ITVGSLQINDNNNYTIAAAGTGRLRFNNGAGNAVVQVLNSLGNGAPSISAPITLESTLQVTNQSAGILDVSGTISQPIALPPNFSAPRGLIKDGAGTLRLSGSASNAYLGDTTVQSGNLQLNKAAGFNAFAGDLVVGDGVGGTGSALLQQLQDDNIPDAAT